MARDDLIFGLVSTVPGAVVGDNGTWHVRRHDRAVTLNRSLGETGDLFVLRRLQGADPEPHRDGGQWRLGGESVTDTPAEVMAQAKRWLVAAA